MEDTGVESLRQVAGNWSLAGDHQLLDILQKTHQRIVSKCQEVTDQLDSMVASLDDTSISLQNVNNRFMALSNSQFIESRVYDDDEDVATETSAVKVPSKPVSMELDLESLKRGLNVLEDAHESLTILHDSDTDTDSEDEAAARTVLRPKDMYSERPLPHIIGTSAWKNKWHAGLVWSDSDSDSGASRAERSRSEYSDSEPESPPHSARLQPPRDSAEITISQSSSERNSLRDETPPASVAMQQTPSDIAAELARRLGGQPPKIAQQSVESEPPPKDILAYRPFKDQPPTVFSDEPPPLEYSSDSEDDIFADLHKSQPYSTSRGVPDLFRFPPPLGGEGEGETDIFNDIPKPQPSGVPNIIEPNDKLANKPQLVKTTADTVDDSTSVKKPIGGISLFGSNKGAETIGAAILKRNRKSSSSDESGNDVPETPQRTVPAKEKDIFDDLFAKSQKINKDKTDAVKTENVSKVDLFGDNIFDDIDDMFTTNVVKVPEKAHKSIFDDNDDLFTEIAAPKTMKPDVKRVDNKKSLFDSDDDELFSVKSASDSTKIAKTKEITKDSSASTSDSTKISKPIQNVATEVKISKTSDIFDDDNVDIFSNTSNNKVQNTITANVDSLTKSNNIFKSPSLFDDDEDDLFTKTIDSDKSTQKDAVISDLGSSGDIYKDLKKDDILVEANKSNDVNQIVTASDVKTDNDIFINETIKPSDITKDITVKSTSNDVTVDNPSASGVNTKYTINSDVTKLNDDDFEQDFDDLPSAGQDRTVLTESQTNLVETTKSNDIFDNIFGSNEISDDKTRSIDTPEDINQSLSKIVDNTLIEESVSEKLHIGTDSIKNTKIEDTAENTNIESPESNKITDKLIKSPENLSAQTEKVNANSLFMSTDTKTSVFDDIFTEPPAFEKPKEPKKSKNVNALFDDDSDDETLFFKKNDAITDVKPNDFTLNRERFDIFIDEPPDVDLEAKTISDDELFSTIPAIPTIDDENSHNIEPNDCIRYDSTDNKALGNEFNVKNDSDDELFQTLPKPAIPSNTNQIVDENKSIYPDNVTITDSIFTKKVMNEEIKNVDDINEIKSNSKGDLFKTTIKSLSKDTDSDEDLFKLPAGVKPVPKATKAENAEINTTEERTRQSENLDDVLKYIPVTSTAKNESKSDSDEELHKTLTNNKIPVTQTSNLESDAEESPKRVGKLKSMNFNINVSALLPGASPKKIKNDIITPKEPHKPITTDIKPNTQANITEVNTANVDKTDSNDSMVTKSVSFEEDPESGILDNKLSKERARIQVKRRPSTRRARMEAARKSGIDFGDDSTDNSSSIDDQPKPTHENNLQTVDPTIKINDSIEKSSPTTQTDLTSVHKADIQPVIGPKSNVNTKIVYILNDEDIFDMPIETNPVVNTIGNTYKALETNTKSSETTSDMSNLNKVPISSSDINNTSNNVNITSNNAKSINKNPSASNNTKSIKIDEESVKKSIFDSDSDGELFTTKRAVKNVVKGPLFSDDDDDDLFGTKKKNEPKSRATRAAVVKEPQKNTEPVFDDPLSMLGDED